MNIQQASILLEEAIEIATSSTLDPYQRAIVLKLIAFRDGWFAARRKAESKHPVKAPDIPQPTRRFTGLGIE